MNYIPPDFASRKALDADLLAAAAPDLYDALQAMLYAVHPVARAALAKARGE